MEVIDLFTDDSPARKPVICLNDQEVRVTSREGRKAANRIAHKAPALEWAMIAATVQSFCVANPGVRDIDQIVAQCEPLLLDAAGGDGNQGSAPSATTIRSRSARDNGAKRHLSEDIDVDDPAFDDICVVSTYSPLSEVLTLFPNAKRGFVEALLAKHDNKVEPVVQSMLDNGFEKEESNSASSAASGPPPAPAVDFTSSAWETTAAYRKDALTELARNFPFLTQPSIAQYFKKEKFHFYHTLMGIEKLFKLPALQFAPAKVLNIASAVAGTDAESAPKDAVRSPSPPVKASPPKKAGGASVGDVINLMDSQSESQADVVVVTSTSSSSSSSAGRGSTLTRKPSVPPKTSQFLSKAQVAELRGRCDKATTGLAVKAVVMATYRASIEENISYVLQPLDPVLEQEIAYISQLKQRELMQADQAAAEKLNEELATAEGSLMECGCCYGEYAFEALVQCSEGHLFCRLCLQRYCEQTVFGNGRSAIKCMNTSEACEGFFSDSMLRHSLPDKVFEKFSQALSRDALTAAHVEGLVTCCHCAMQMLMEEDAGNVAVCFYCSKETCRLCGEASHVPLRCSEVEKKGETSARLSVEEAMTQARLRECQKCKTRFFKTEGCNKMTCRCGANICYICREDISKVGYGHFCQTAHCDHKKCKKCKLFTDSVEDDVAAMKEAGVQALLAQQQQQPGAAGADGAAGSSSGAKGSAGAAAATAKIDLDKLLETNPNRPKTATLRAPPLAPPVYAPGPAMGRAGMLAAAAAAFGDYPDRMALLHQRLGNLAQAQHEPPAHAAARVREMERLRVEQQQQRERVQAQNAQVMRQYHQDQAAAAVARREQAAERRRQLKEDQARIRREAAQARTQARVAQAEAQAQAAAAQAQALAAQAQAAQIRAQAQAQVAQARAQVEAQAAQVRAEAEAQAALVRAQDAAWAAQVRAQAEAQAAQVRARTAAAAAAATATAMATATATATATLTGTTTRWPTTTITQVKPEPSKSTATITCVKTELPKPAPTKPEPSQPTAPIKTEPPKPAPTTTYVKTEPHKRMKKEEE